MLLNAAYGILQLKVGYAMLGSLILVTDSFHNLTDAVSLGIPLVAILVASRFPKASDVLTWINYLLLLGLMLYAAIEAAVRIYWPESTSALAATATLPLISMEVKAGYAMALLALVGIVVNGFSVWILEKRASHDLNMESASMHQLADLIASIVAFIASIAIAVTGQHIVDPILTILTSAFLIWMVWPKFKESWTTMAKPKKGDHSHNH